VCTENLISQTSITNESPDGLGLAPGKDAYAVIKSSNVMVAVD
jgi:molybdopterin-binding protein